MKRMIAFAAAVVLVTATAPALAHEANYPGEGDDRQRNEKCERHDEVSPAHDKCTGIRNHMWTSDNSLVKRSIGLAVSDDASFEAYVHHYDDGGDGEEPTDLTPGLVWIESNGFEGLQRNGFECQSPQHENPDEWQTHADQVLI